MEQELRLEVRRGRQWVNFSLALGRHLTVRPRRRRRETTAVTLEAPSSYVSVANLLGQVIKLITPGTGTVVTPDGNMTPPGVPPAWVLALIEALNNLLGFQQVNIEVIYNSAENPCTAAASPNCNN